jgi:hypothetical protein
MIIPIETPYHAMSRTPLSDVVAFQMELSRSSGLQNMVVFLSDFDNGCNLRSFATFYAGLRRPSYGECEGDMLDNEDIIAALSVDAYQLMQDMVTHF